MKTSLILATLFVVGASAAGAGAANNFATSPYIGSDTEYNITNQAILNSGLGNLTVGPSLTAWNAQTNPLGDYSGGGSNGAENTMAAAAEVQQTGPMARMLAGPAGKGACAAANVTSASGIVLGIDAVRVFASNAVISANQTACNGATSTAACTQDPSGLVYNGTIANGTTTATFTNWRDVLALLYGGLDRSTGIVDCTSAKRQLLVSAWTNLFQNSTCTNTNGTALTHAWRRDDNSGVSDLFSNLAGFQAAEKDQFGNTTAKFSVSASAVNGFGTSPYCNTLNWDTTEAAKIPDTSASACSNAADLHYMGPGGVPVASSADPKCVAGSNATTACHHVPPPLTYGVQPLGTQSVVLPTSYQDNDPIRTACLGSGVLNHASDDVCNTDGKLGIVLPVPALDFIHTLTPGLVSYTGAVDCGSGSIAGDPPKVFTCAPRGKGTTGNGLCPNNDAPLGIGCLIPIGTGSGGATSQCQATKSEGVTCFTGPCGSDARVYNLQAYDGTGTDSVHNAHYLNVSYAVNDGSGANGTVGSFTQSINMAGAFGRIHQREKGTNGKYVCELNSADDQIGCLAQADPNSLGIGGNDGDKWEQSDPNASSGCTSCSLATAPNTQGLRVSQLEAGTSCLPAAAGSGLASYPLWRKLYMNSIVGFSNVTHTAELNLAQYESEDNQLNTILTQYGEFTLPFSPNGSGPGGAPAQFCEDFNESLSGTCNSGTTNANACNTNVGLTTSGFGTIPSDPSSVPGSATTSTVCGNGVLEDFEDCDIAITLTTTSNPTLAACGTCSSTCRCSLF